MIQFLSEQPIILWSIVASVVLFLAAAAIGLGQSYLKKRRQREKLKQKSIARTRAAESPIPDSQIPAATLEIMEETTTLSDPAGPTETNGDDPTPPEKSGEFQINSVEAASEPDESFEVEEDSMLASIFSEEVIVDPKFVALVTRQSEIEVGDLAHTAEDILAQLQTGRPPAGEK